MGAIKAEKPRDDFDHVAQRLVSRLHKDVVQESCVVFVGAGSTTERSWRAKDRGFYATIKAQTSHSGTNLSPSFPKLMESFCNELDGGHHNRLIREAISYLEQFSLPGEDNRTATMVSDLLAEIPYFNRFVTTNWDPFIERALDVLVPIFEDRDLAFWDDKKRQVLKIHGCITRPYSVVATQNDYDNCMAQNPLIFNKLRDLMATKPSYSLATACETLIFKKCGVILRVDLGILESSHMLWILMSHQRMLNIGMSVELNHLRPRTYCF
ncbi:SIR2 family protein [Alloacidobacterium sp.]|uniref:SIR2 family protein n=1 Tax=Alloacidobacterium sp. TaxID=2951999 RepID=UPI002D38C32B|nr:SIR2 family protein [Alloacidobacterium sp.]HYK37275.1 SIR2 family protein [Alloacidobacterium sp.]